MAGALLPAGSGLVTAAPRSRAGTGSGRQVALIRGINVGKAKRVAMADLRAVMEDLGFGAVRTLLNSGNVVFTVSASPPEKSAARIETALAERLGVSARVTVVSGDELRVMTARKPFGKIADNPSRILVAVLADPRDRGKLGPVTTEDWAPEALALGPRAAYLWCPEGVIRSRVAKAIDRALGDGVTTRNWATMRKLRDLLDAG